MCDVMIRSRVRSRVVRSYLPGQASLALRYRSNEGVANGQRGKMAEDRNKTPVVAVAVAVLDSISSDIASPLSLSTVAGPA